MTPELTALARAYMALPGAPQRLRIVGGFIVQGQVTKTASKAARETETGILWVQSDAEWLPDLTDRANGGVMLATLGSGWLAYQRDADGRWEVSRPDGEHRQEGATPAEAVARVAVAVGRAG